MVIICRMIKYFKQTYGNTTGILHAWLLTLLLLCAQVNSFAANNTINSAEKIFINADYMQLNIESGSSVYIGNVKISQGALVLTGDKVTLEQTSDALERITITGKPAHYNHVTEKGENIQAESEHMVYTASQNKLVMTVNAKLLQPDHKVSSQKIVYDTEKQIVIAGDKSDPASGTPNKSQRVNITLTPKKEPQTQPKP